MRRHIGPLSKNTELEHMLKSVAVSSLQDMLNKVYPQRTRVDRPKVRPHGCGVAKTEENALHQLGKIMEKNTPNRSFLGQGFHGAILPEPIKRHLLENPKWYTAYTPYQSEISQGRLESQFLFQQAVKDLVGLPVANASLLDEGSAAAEAISLCYRTKPRRVKNPFIFMLDTIHPHIRATMVTKCRVLGIDIVLFGKSMNGIGGNYQINQCIGCFFQYPDTLGELSYKNPVVAEVLQLCNKREEIPVVAITDPLALTLFKSPGELGCDIGLGSGGRLGMPMWFGGPHPAYFAAENRYLRHMPGRIVGESYDIQGNPGYRLALQTREQHIKRTRASSNICTSQSLLSSVAAMFCVYHGPDGLKNISENILAKVDYAAKHISAEHIVNKSYFDTLTLDLYKENTSSSSSSSSLSAEHMRLELQDQGLLLRQHNAGYISFSVDETTSMKDINRIVRAYNKYTHNKIYQSGYQRGYQSKSTPDRTTPILIDERFSLYHSETEFMRYLTRLASKDYSLADGMMPLGSCTMKLNAASQLAPLSWKSVGNYHPFSPKEFVGGYMQLIEEVGNKLKNLCGFDHISFQSNSGAMGEYAGMLCIKEYHRKTGDNRNICLIPESAHGTNFASAVMACFEVVTFPDTLFYDLVAFKEKIHDIKENHGDIAGIMITYPGTNGVFQENIDQVCDIVHEAGGLVYMDGANMNALVGHKRPGDLGFDICHLNLHKTFCIPHGGGGPGMGPILCNDKLAPFLPIQINNGGSYKSIGAITSSQWSSAALLTIPWMYLETMGSNIGKSTEYAILAANYLKSQLQDHYTIIDTNQEGFVAHEFIIDVSEFANRKVGITEEDIAKRLIDYSFHPPTMSWPRSRVMMFEPTESESLAELDRLVEAMKSIRREIDEEPKLLKNAPHATHMVTDWPFHYSIERALYPVCSLKNNNTKFHVPIGRIHNAIGDKKLLGIWKD